SEGCSREGRARPSRLPRKCPPDLIRRGGPMNDREFFQVRRQAEKDVFLRVMRAMPAGRLDYKPHERSPSAADLLATLVSEHGICGDLVMNGRCEYKVDPVAGVEEAARA